MTSRILLIGKNGQLGNQLAHLLTILGDVVALDRNQLNLSEPLDIRRVIREIKPVLIVNAAAYTAVDQAEKDEAFARAINAEAPGVIGEEAKRIGAALVHYSTDYIFDGTKNSPYLEPDSPNLLNAYGRTKLAGEKAIRDSGVSHLIFRTAWVYGVRGRNVLLTVLRLATQKDELRIVRDQIGAPTWSHEIATATIKVLQQSRADKQLDLTRSGGTYHLTAGGETNWAEFASAILEHAKTVPPAAWFASAIEKRPLSPIASFLSPLRNIQLLPAAHPIRCFRTRSFFRRSDFNYRLAHTTPVRFFLGAGTFRKEASRGAHLQDV